MNKIICIAKILKVAIFWKEFYCFFDERMNETYNILLIISIHIQYLNILNMSNSMRKIAIPKVFLYSQNLRYWIVVWPQNITETKVGFGCYMSVGITQSVDILLTTIICSPCASNSILNSSKFPTFLLR